MLPEPRYDLTRFTADLSRETRKQSWFYHFSFRQVRDHVDYLGRRLQASMKGRPMETGGSSPDEYSSEDLADHAGAYLVSQARKDLEALRLTLEDRYIMTKTELMGKLTGLLGGRAAEEVIFNETTTGSENDLEVAGRIRSSDA